MNTFGMKKLPNGKGGFGTCYILDNDTLYKKFHKQINGKLPFSYDYFDKFIGIENDSFVFPKEIETKGDYTLGYTMDYIHADTLEILDFDYSITDFIIALKKLREDLVELTNDGIVVCDVNAKNMLFDGSKIYVIDTDGYEPKYNVDLDPEKENEKYIVRYLYFYFVLEKNIKQLKTIIEENDYLDEINRDMSNWSNAKNVTFSSLKEFLYELRDYVSRLVHKDIDNFNDLYETLGQIR